MVPPLRRAYQGKTIKARNIWVIMMKRAMTIILHRAIVAEGMDGIRDDHYLPKLARKHR